MQAIVGIPEISSDKSHQAAAIDKLKQDGWKQASSLPFSWPTYYHDDVKTIDDAKTRLRSLGLDPDLFLFADHPENAEWSENPT